MMRLLPDLAYGFNDHRTVGSQPLMSLFVVRKMKNIDWLDGEGMTRYRRA
ncbi:hypothetical protein ACLK19_08360 [Escherichia coli]